MRKDPLFPMHVQYQNTCLLYRTSKHLCTRNTDFFSFSSNVFISFFVIFRPRFMVLNENILMENTSSVKISPQMSSIFYSMKLGTIIQHHNPYDVKNNRSSGNLFFVLTGNNCLWDQKYWITPKKIRILVCHLLIHARAPSVLQCCYCLCFCSPQEGASVLEGILRTQQY